MNIASSKDQLSITVQMVTKYSLVPLIFLFTLLLHAQGFCITAEQGEGFIQSPDGVHVFYRVVGSGPHTLVVVHGGPGNTMDSILPDFEPLTRNYTVIYYDQRGNGQSDLVKTKKSLSLAKHIEDLEALRIYFNLEKMTLLGNSWGGLLASYYALEHPDRVERLVLHSPASPSFQLLEESTAYIHQRIPEDKTAAFRSLSVPDKWVNTSNPREICRKFYEILVPVYFSDQEKARSMRGDVCAGSEEAVRQQQVVNRIIWESMGKWDILKMLNRLSAPTLVIHGRYDMIPVESSVAWTAALANARLLIIEDSGHMTHIEQPEKFFGAVEKFFQGEWPEEAIIIPKNSFDE